MSIENEIEKNIKRLTHKMTIIRRTAVKVLGELGAKGAIHTIKQIQQQDENASVRAAATRTLEKLI